MTLEEAVAWVRVNAMTEYEPTVPDEHIELVLADCVKFDSDGNAPQNDDGTLNADWTPTWWLNDACYAIWSRKLNLAMQWVDVSTDGTSVKHSQAVAGLKREAERWRMRCGGSV